MKYTVKDLRVDFPDEDACLQWLVAWLYPNGITCKKCKKVTNHYKVKGRRSYSCSECGHHVHPTAGTICHNSHIPLTDWFYAIYLMSTNKAGTPATQIQRELGCTYKTAWRMMHQIRNMMSNPEGLLVGSVQADEMYVHANTFKRSSARRKYGYDARRTGQVLFGIVQPGGVAKVWHVPGATAYDTLHFFREHVRYGSTVHTDGWNVYQKLPKMGYGHKWTDHGAHQYYTKASHTQNIENLWSTMKPRWKGTFKHISAKYLQAYTDEFVWRYNNRGTTSMFWALLGEFAEGKQSVDS